MARKGEDDDYYDDDDYGDYYSTEEDNATQCDSDDDGGFSDGDEAQAKAAEETDDEDLRAKSLEDRETGYDFVTEDEVRRCQDAVTSDISEVLSVPRGFAVALLRHCRWDPELLKNEWFSDEARVRAAVGLAPPPSEPDAADVPTVLNDAALTCVICFERHGPGGMRSAGCRTHFYCHECWRGYIHAAVGDGSRCLLLRCPDPQCPAPIVRELVDAAAGVDDRARYETFVVRSYVEEGTNKYVRWCPGPGCTRAVRAHEGSRLSEVTCECGHLLCFRCGEDGHRPAPCETARAWSTKCRADGGTTSWVLENTKHCPKCQRAIEKNQGCNHMTCGAPCRHQFCWLCLGSWANHDGDSFNCNRYNANKAAFEGKASREQQARASMERFLHYYERWVTHGESMDRARQDLAGLLRGGGLAEFAEVMGVQPTDLDFLKSAYEQVIEARRVLRWTYAHIYHMDPERDDVEFCEFLQGLAEGSLERLHKCAEGERKEMANEIGPCRAAIPDEYAAGKFVEFRMKLTDLDTVARSHFRKLVERYESSGTADVVS
ncbi:unnamed protein product [Urochloa humidicola]